MSYYVINSGRAYGSDNLVTATLIQESLQSLGEAAEVVCFL